MGCSKVGYLVGANIRIKNVISSLFLVLLGWLLAQGQRPSFCHRAPAVVWPFHPDTLTAEEELCSYVPLCSLLIDRSFFTDLSLLAEHVDGLLIPMNGLDRFSSGLISHEKGGQMGKRGLPQQSYSLSAR